jgi:hypothetical protein
LYKRHDQAISPGAEQFLKGRGWLRVIRVSEEEQRFYRNLNEPDDLNDRLGRLIAL